MNNKDFDAVKMMCDIRDNHRKLYVCNPEIREKRLMEIRIKYAKKITQKDSINPNDPPSGL
jgi:hypothetical protein